MAILNRANLPNHGPYIDILYRHDPLVFPEVSWPHPASYRETIVFELADDLLGALCQLTGQYSPFDCYEVTNLNTPEQLQELQAHLVRWRDTIRQLPKERLADKCTWLYDAAPDTPVEPERMRADLVDTLVFLIEQVASAARNHDTITIVGI